jgi:adenosine deaminase
LEAFAQTVAVLQSGEALERVAGEAIEDLAADGVVYAELRFAPSLHCTKGLTREKAIESVLSGCGNAAARTGTVAGVIVVAMRQQDDAAEVVAAASRFRERGVVAVDLAGPEAGFPAKRHREALASALAAGLHLTIHAGEAEGPEGIADALDCGAERIGHGVRVVDDIEIGEGGIVRLGSIARRVLEGGIPLEVCLASNLDTGAFASAEQHPVGLLHRAGFAVTLNTDNRLMSATTMSAEFGLSMAHQGFGMADLRAVTLRAADAAFCDEATRRDVRARVEAGYDAA